jgi:hypothetical protein
MKFHVAVVQRNGEVTDRGERTSAQVRDTDVGRQLATAFGLMLEEQLLRVVAGPVKESLPLFDDRRGLLEWRWVEPFSASAAFFIAGAVTFTWFYFSGHHPDADAMAARATEHRVNSPAAEAGLKDPGFRPDSLRERPPAVCVPWPPSAPEPERRIVGDYAVCLAAAYFDKAAAVLRRGAALGGGYAGHGG